MHCCEGRVPQCTGCIVSQCIAHRLVSTTACNQSSCKIYGPGYGRGRLSLQLIKYQQAEQPLLTKRRHEREASIMKSIATSTVCMQGIASLKSLGTRGTCVRNSRWQLLALSVLRVEVPGVVRGLLRPFAQGLQLEVVVYWSHWELSRILRQ